MRTYTGFLLIIAAFMAGCAAPRTAPPPPSPLPSPPPSEELPAAPAPEKEARPEELEGESADYPLPDVRSEPALARYAHLIDSAPPPERPGILLARAGKAIDEAQRLRRRRMDVWNVLPIEDEIHFVAYYRSAEEDCREILGRWPESPEAAEAQYTLGTINDYPHMTEFQKAEMEYRVTTERYPGTKAAAKAEARIRHLHRLLGSPAPAAPPSP